MSMFEQTTAAMAHQAALAINEFMAHWNDRLPNANPDSVFHGAKVCSLARILATPEYHPQATLWEASFDRDCTNLCFQICNGVAHFPNTRLFSDAISSDLLETPADNNQRPSEQLQPDQSSRH